MLLDNPEDDLCDVLRLWFVGRSLLIGRLIGLSIWLFVTLKLCIGSSVTSLTYSTNSIYSFASSYASLSNIYTSSFNCNPSVSIYELVKHGVPYIMLSCLSFSGVSCILSSFSTYSASITSSSASDGVLFTINFVADLLDYLEDIICEPDSASILSSSASLFYSVISILS